MAALTCNLVVRGVLQCGQYFVLLVPGYSSVIGAPQRMQYLQTGVQRVFLMTRLAEFTGLICSYGVRSWPDRTFVSLAEEISNEKRESRRHQACRLDRRRSGFALRDLM